MADQARGSACDRRLLVLAYYFEPQTSVGVFRTTRFVKHLLRKGWQVDVVTVANPDPQFEPVRPSLPTDIEMDGRVKVHRVKSWPVKPLWQWPTALLNRLGRWLGRANAAEGIAAKFWHIDMQWGFASAVKPMLANLLASGDFDLLYVSCPPFSSSEVAVEAGEAADVPVLLDFRDSWVPSSYAVAETAHYDALERSLLARAAGLIVNTEADIALYRDRIDQQKLTWIPNGFDAPLEGPFPAPAQKKAVQFTYLGAWSAGTRDPHLLLEVLKEKPWDWHLRTYANDHKFFMEAAKDVGVADKVSCHAFVPKDQLGGVIAESDCLILVQGYGTDPTQAVSHVAAKTYDYLATGRMILGLCADGAMRDLLGRYPNHHLLAGPDNRKEISQALDQLHALWQQGGLPNMPDPAFLATYSETALGDRLADLCTQLSDPRSAK